VSAAGATLALCEYQTMTSFDLIPEIAKGSESDFAAAVS
jgi:hypothetical protein